MSSDDIGVAVIGAGMAGKAHASGYLLASTVYDSVLPRIRPVSIIDAFEPLAASSARRYGYARHDVSWRSLVDADDVDVVSVVVANALHREIVEALLAAGKHVLCEKPLSDSVEDAQAMVAVAAKADTIARIGLTYKRSPGLAYLAELVRDGTLGSIYNVNGVYWTDYACNPGSPISWRYKGPAGSGALADVGSHLTYLAEFLGGGRFSSVWGGTLNTVIKTRAMPVGNVVGHEGGAVSDVLDTVDNDDVAAFSGELTNGATATVQVSRVAAGHPNSLALEVFGEKGAASFDLRHPGEVKLYLHGGERASSGYRTIQLGPDHPYWRGGLAMDAPGVGIGQNDGFVFQARAFLEEVAGIPEEQSLPRNADFEDGLRNMRLLDAVARSALQGGATITLGS